jgi:hypothetical protein
MLWPGHRASTIDHHDMDGMPGMTMPGMTEPNPPAPHWDWVEATALAATLAALVWWWRSKHPLAAASTAAGLAVLATSRPVRVLVTQSHLVAMTAMEILLVAVPMLALAALPSRPVPAEDAIKWGGAWATLTGVSATIYAGLVPQC